MLIILSLFFCYLQSKVIRNVKKDKLTNNTGFGFVTFKRHCDALQCLRRLNNNPEIFYLAFN